MSANQTMVAVNKFVLTQLDRLSVHVILAIVYHLTVQTALVKLFISCNITIIKLSYDRRFNDDCFRYQ